MSIPNSIICPSCNTPISLDEALTNQIRATLLSDIEEKSKAQSEKFKKQADDLRLAQEALELQKVKSEEQIKERIAQERIALEQKLKAQLTQEKQVEVKFLQEQLDEQKKKAIEAQNRELVLRKKEVELEEAQRSLQLDVQRQLDEERKRIQEKTASEIFEQQRQKDMEKEKVISDLRHSLEDAQRKATQGSQQTQGEVQELALEDLLRTNFPQDVIEPVGKGVAGADVRQIVRSRGGTICGVILWESKQTKSWSEGWITKLKTDLRAEKADIPAIVTAAAPTSGWSGMMTKDGVWICSLQLVLPLAQLLRKAVVDVGYQKAVQQHQGEKADEIYEYITGNAFRQQVSSIVEVYHEMSHQISRERAAMEKIWKQRESQSLRIMTGVGSIFGSIQGIAGASAIPQLEGLELSDDADELDQPEQLQLAQH